MIFILIMIFILQFIFLTLCGPAIKVVQWGLDPYGWAICVLFGMGGWIVSALFKFIPLEKALPGSGKEEITKEELNRRSTMSLKRDHNEEFYKKKETLIHRSSFMEAGMGRKISITKKRSLIID